MLRNKKYFFTFLIGLIVLSLVDGLLAQINPVFLNTGPMLKSITHLNDDNFDETYCPRCTVLYPEPTPGMFLGVSVGVNLISYKTTLFATVSSEPDCSPVQNGAGVAPMFEISGEFPIGEGMQNFFIFKASYDSKSAKLSIVNSDPKCYTFTNSFSASLNYLALNAGYKYNFSSAPSLYQLGVELCVSAGIIITGNFNKTVTVSTGEVVKNSVPIDGIRSILWGLRGQFSYDIPLSPNGSWTATPFLGYEYPLTKVDNTNRNWSVSTLYAGMSLYTFINL